LAGYSQEVGPVLPVGLALVDEGQEGFVDECGRLEGVAGALAA
jgi:hypothetical protein